MKYIDADLLRKEIERRITDNTFGAKLELIDILAWLDTLSEEPDKSLEEAAEGYIKKGRYLPEAWVVRPAFVAGAEWQARQLLQGSPMPEDTVLFNKGVQEGRRLEKEEKDLGWHPSTEHPPVDEEVIVLLGRYEDFPQIAFGHIVDQNIAIDYNGWNIPGVMYWMPMPKLPEEK